MKLIFGKNLSINIFETKNEEVEKEKNNEFKI